MPVLLILLVDALLILSAGLFAYQGQTALCLSILAATAFLVFWQCVLSGAVRAAGETIRIEKGLRSPHYIQAMLTFSIYLYWSRYWDEVIHYAPLIVVQLVFAYGFEMLLSWTRHHVWRAGFGPFPIVFSINLFLWFKPEWYVFQFLLLMLTYIGKETLRWNRDGRRTHIFNPSGFSLTVASVLLLMTGTTSTISSGADIVASFTLPPNFFEVLFCLSLVVQLLYRTAPVTVGTMLMLAVLHKSAELIIGTPIARFVIDPSVFLGLTFLVTDPSTSPRSTAGKFLYGMAYGLGVFTAFLVLRMLQQPAFIDKIVAVPAVNLLARYLDRVGVAIDGRMARFRWTSRVAVPRFAFVLLSFVTFLVLLPGLKSPYQGPLPDFLPHSVAILSPSLSRVLNHRDYSRAVLPESYRPFGFGSEVADYHRIRTIYRTGVYQSRIEDFTEAIRRDPDYSQAYYWRGLEYRRSGRSDKAIADFSESIRLEPDNALAYLDRGIAYGMKRQLDDAIADFDKALRLNPDLADAYYYRGHAYRLKGDQKTAEADFSTAKKNGSKLESE